jgi:radical SAM protein with 4Fe4S-binding SPASM domain
MFYPFIKPANAILAGFSYLKRDTSLAGMPLIISTELTNNCNLQCPECISGSGKMQRARGFMDIQLFDKILNELSPYLYNINLYFQGEPMLHPLFFSFIGNSKKIHTTVSTNGHFLNEENAERIAGSGLGKLIIALDGMDQETYGAYRKNGNVNTVVKGIRNVTLAKKKIGSSLQIEIQFLVNRLNENQIPNIKQFAHEVGASLNLKSMQVIDKGDIETWLPRNRKFSRYEVKEGEYVIKSSLPDRCTRLWFNPVITWDGKVIPCCFDKNAEHVMGDLNTDSFGEIWGGPKYRIFRKSILSGRQMIEICRNCTSGLRCVKY